MYCMVPTALLVSRPIWLLLHGTYSLCRFCCTCYNIFLDVWLVLYGMLWSRRHRVLCCVVFGNAFPVLCAVLCCKYCVLVYVLYAFCCIVRGALLPVLQGTLRCLMHRPSFLLGISFSVLHWTVGSFLLRCRLVCIARCSLCCILSAGALQRHLPAGSRTRHFSGANTAECSWGASTAQPISGASTASVAQASARLALLLLLRSRATARSSCGPSASASVASIKTPRCFPGHVSVWKRFQLCSWERMPFWKVLRFVSYATV